MARFGGIDILVNNASAISLTGTLETPMKRFDLMFGVNVRGTFVCSQACLPHLKASAAAGRNPHILTLSPPLNLDPKWFKDHVAYTIAKYGMSMCVLGMAEEFRADGIGVNALWPRTVIATAAVAMIPGASERVDMMRRPAILADAAHVILDARRAEHHRQLLHRRRRAGAGRHQGPLPLRHQARRAAAARSVPRLSSTALMIAARGDATRAVAPLLAYAIGGLHATGSAEADLQFRRACVGAMPRAQPERARAAPACLAPEPQQ